MTALCKRTFCLTRPGEPVAGMFCHFAYSGAIPCTGPKLCLYCGEPEHPSGATPSFEPLRPLHAHDDGRAYYQSAPQHAVSAPRVHYGDGLWPSRSYWLVPAPEAPSFNCPLYGHWYPAQL